MGSCFLLVCLLLYCVGSYEKGDVFDFVGDSHPVVPLWLKKEVLKNGKKGKWMKRKRAPTTHSVMWENYKMDFLVFLANFSLINMYETGDSDSLWFSRIAFMKIFCYFNIFIHFITLIVLIEISNLTSIFLFYFWIIMIFFINILNRRYIFWTRKN